MVLALHIEEFLVERVEIGNYYRVGAVLVLPNDMIYAVDCSRNGVHGVAGLLIWHTKISFKREMESVPIEQLARNP